MTASKALWILAPAAGLFMLSSAAAQDHMIGGEAIPADQVQVVEDWCDELQAQQGLTGTQEPETTMTEEQTEAAVGSENADSTGFDVSTVTLEMCQEGGFTEQDDE